MSPATSPTTRSTLSTAKLAWLYLWSRPVRSGLNLLMLVLALTAMTVVLSLRDQVSQAFERHMQGIDAVVGAKGSPIQLILSGVYHLDAPPGNIALADMLLLRQHPQVQRVIPLSLGDNVAGFRIVGTEPSYLDLYGARLATGQVWAQPMQAVLGHWVAQRTQLQVGDTFAGVHGLGAGGEAHGDTPYIVSGVLAPCGCMADRLALTSTESVWQVHDDLHDDGELTAQDRLELEADREVTLALVTYRTPLAALTFPRFVNQTTPMQAAAPALEVTRLLSMLGAGSRLLEGFVAALLVMAALSVALALWSAVLERQPDLALLRMLGTPTHRLVTLLLAEAFWLAAMAVAIAAVLSQGVLAALLHQLPAEALPLWQAWVWTPSLWWPLVVTVLLACVAAALPAWRAWRVDVLHAL